MSTVDDDDDVDSEIQMFQNALVFWVKARDVMSPRTEIVAIDLFDTIAELKELLLKRLLQNCGLWEFTWWDCICTLLWFV
jgi:Mg2+/Co2+ transporter CorB